MFCANCGQKNEDGAKFCRNCGNLLVEQGPTPSTADPESIKQEKQKDPAESGRKKEIGMLTESYRKAFDTLRSVYRLSTTPSKRPPSAYLADFDILLQYSMLEVAFNDGEFERPEMALIRDISEYEDFCDYASQKCNTSITWDALFSLSLRDFKDLKKGLYSDIEQKEESLLQLFVSVPDLSTIENLLPNLRYSIMGILETVARADGEFDNYEISAGATAVALIDQIEQRIKSNVAEQQKRQQQKDKENNVCPHCGAQITSFALFCNACGRNIGEQSLQNNGSDRYLKDIQQELDRIDRKYSSMPQEGLLEKANWIRKLTPPDPRYPKILLDLITYALNQIKVDAISSAEKELNFAWIEVVRNFYETAQLHLQHSRYLSEIQSVYDKILLKEEQIKKKDQKERGKKKRKIISRVVLIGIAALLILFMVLKIRSCAIHMHDGEGKLPDQTKFIGKDYAIAVAEYEEIGFKNIKIERKSIETAASDWSDKRVVSIQVQNPDRKTWLPLETEIIIEYFSTDGMIQTNIQEFSNQPQETVLQHFSNLGFANIVTETVKDKEHIQSGAWGDVAEIEIEGRTDWQSTWFSPNLNVTIRYYAEDGKIRVPTENLKGKTFQAVEDLLRACGFESFDEERVGPIADLNDYRDLSVVQDVLVNGASYENIKDRWLSNKSICTIQWKPKTAIIPKDKMKDKEYETVVQIFQAAGFINITTEAAGDLITGWISKKNTVIEVLINGSTEYEPGTEVAVGATVVIRYHSWK